MARNPRVGAVATRAGLRVGGYPRVSREEAALDGASIEQQPTKIRQYCELHELDLVAMEVDDGYSAKSIEGRPGLVKLLGMLDSCELDGIVVSKLDRLSRSLADWTALVEKYFNERAGKYLFSVGESIDTRTASGRMVLNMIMTVAQWERETIAERVAGTMAYLKTINRRVGPTPYGFRVRLEHVAGASKPRQWLEPDPEEHPQLVRILGWAAEGASHRKIAARLEAEGVPSKNGRPWSPGSVQSIVRRNRDGGADGRQSA